MCHLSCDKNAALASLVSTKSARLVIPWGIWSALRSIVHRYACCYSRRALSWISVINVGSNFSSTALYTDTAIGGGIARVGQAICRGVPTSRAACRQTIRVRVTPTRTGQHSGTWQQRRAPKPLLLHIISGVGTSGPFCFVQPPPRPNANSIKRPI